MKPFSFSLFLVFPHLAFYPMFFHFSHFPLLFPSPSLPTPPLFWGGFHGQEEK